VTSFKSSQIFTHQASAYLKALFFWPTGPTLAEARGRELKKEKKEKKRKKNMFYFNRLDKIRYKISLVNNI
jgi:hypothetical protein